MADRAHRLAWSTSMVAPKGVVTVPSMSIRSQLQGEKRRNVPVRSPRLSVSSAAMAVGTVPTMPESVRKAKASKSTRSETVLEHRSLSASRRECLQQVQLSS